MQIAYKEVKNVQEVKYIIYLMVDETPIQAYLVESEEEKNYQIQTLLISNSVNKITKLENKLHV